MIVGNLVLDEDEAVAAYVALKLSSEPFEKFTAVGVLYRGEMAGGVVFHNQLKHNDQPFSIEISAAFEHAKWCKRGVLRGIARYVFGQLGVVRVEASTARRNKRSRRVLKKLGFTEEGIRAKRYKGTDDQADYGMTRDQCKWID